MADARAATVNRIVVGVDLSETGDHALREALRLAQYLPNSELHVTYVIRSDAGMHDARRLKEMADEVPERMEDLREHLEKACAAPWVGNSFTQAAVAHVRIGSPAEALVQVAVDVDAEMIVVGTHGRAGLEKLMLGSVAQELTRIAPLPVVVARPKDLRALKKSQRPEPRQPGDDVPRAAQTDRIHLEFVARNSHISGLL
jgi:nucleotide-binding universal stress UspA family protein